MPVIPPKLLPIVQAKEAEITAKFGAPFYQRLVEGKYTPPEFWAVWQFLAKLG
jgi:hypothetical protein